MLQIFVYSTVYSTDSKKETLSVEIVFLHISPRQATYR